MAYIDVLPLAVAKNYLRVDDTLTEDDARITSFINTALAHIEKQTNVLVYARNNTYFFSNFCVYVYDYPINLLVSPTNAERTEKQNYSIYTTTKTDDKKLVLNVGYNNPVDVPSEIIDCALEYIKYLYYDAETNKGASNKIPPYIMGMIHTLKRFIL